MIKSFFAFVAVLVASNKSRHGCDHIVMTIMVIKIKVLICGRARVDQGVQVFLGYNVKLLPREYSLEPPDLIETTRAKRHTSSIVKVDVAASVRFSDVFVL